MDWAGDASGRRKAASEQTQVSSPSHAAKETSKPPMGILSQTLAPSPTVRWILPARIRSTLYNDVVFVGETFVQLREFQYDGPLAEVTAKYNVGSQILAANVLTAEKENISFMNQVLEQHTETEHFVVNGKPIEDNVPPQILVITIATGQVLFLYAKTLEQGDSRFLSAKLTLPREVVLNQSFGRQIAVDPRSRAIAIASASRVALVVPKNVAQIKKQIESFNPRRPDSFRPVDQQHFIHVDGFILRMDFLRSPGSDPDQVILLMLVANEGTTSMLLYCWDSKEPLDRTIALPVSGQTLHPEDSFPLMLIPSSRQTSFIVVTETALVVYDDVLIHPVKRVRVSLPRYTAGDLRGPTRPPLWVQWARAPRLPEHQATEDNIYLVREDGQIRHYIVKHDLRAKIDSSFSPGYLGINVDTALAIVGPYSQGGDILIAGGDGCDGGVFHLPARQKPACIQAISNWSPTTDMLNIPTREDGAGRLFRQFNESERLITCSGNDNKSSFTNEMQFGLEAQVGWKIEYADALSVSAIHFFEHPVLTKLLVLLVHPEHTGALMFDTEDESVETLESMAGLEFGDTTIAAAHLNSGHILQITPRWLGLMSLIPELTSVSVDYSLHPFHAAHILSSSSSFVFAREQGSDFEVLVGLLQIDEEHIPFIRTGKPLCIQSEPTVLRFLYFSNTQLVFVSYANTLCAFAVDADGDLSVIWEVARSAHTGADTMPITSLHLLVSPAYEHGLLLVGTRDGTLTISELRFHDDRFTRLDARFLDRTSLGDTPITLTEEALNPRESAVLATCGSVVWRIQLLDANGGVDFHISPILLNERSSVCYSQPAINAATRIPTYQNACDGGLAGLLVCAAETEILISSLILQDQAVARRLQVNGSPHRLAYSRHLNQLIVSISRTDGFSDRNLGTSSDHAQDAQALQLKDSLRGAGHPKSHSRKVIVPFGSTGDRVRCILNWLPTDGTRHYDMIVLAVDSDAPDEKPRSGKLLCISSRSLLSAGTSSPSLKVVSRYPGKPIYALCAYDRSSLLVAAGNELMLHSLDMQTRKWTTIAQCSLPSPAISIKYSSSVIYVATARHSLMALKHVERSLRTIATDSKARNCSDVLVSGPPAPGIFVSAVSSAGTSLIRFDMPHSNKTLVQTAEALIPISIQRLQPSYSTMTSGTRQGFYGNSVDGTLYRFLTLDSHEWRLLRYLEDLTSSKLIKDEAAGSDDSGSSSDSWDMISPNDSPRPPNSYLNHTAQLRMHIQGDGLMGLLQPGPTSLQALLRPDVKEEKGGNGAHDLKTSKAEFAELATAVVGDVIDPALEVSRWLRKLLRLPH